jgi:hypothetical protein
MSESDMRDPGFRHSASLRAFTPVFDGLWTRVNALMAHPGYREALPEHIGAAHDIVDDHAILGAWLR